MGFLSEHAQLSFRIIPANHSPDVERIDNVARGSCSGNILEYIS
ncbi:MAG: hypothetical protein ACJAV7_002141 [Flavobacteriales bacterium]|jgi:hypothetical protein